MVSRKKLVIAASTIYLVTVTLFLQIGVFANQTSTAGDFTVEAEDYDVFYDCNRDGKVDMLDIFGCILRYGTEGDTVRTSYLSVTPTAFMPAGETQSYYRYATKFVGNGAFHAHVHLPHGATVTNMTVWLEDGKNDGFVTVNLYKVEIGVSIYAMAQVHSGTTETPGYVSMVDDTINHSTVDNNGSVYQLYMQLSYEDTNLALYGVVIEYEYTP